MSFGNQVLAEISSVGKEEKLPITHREWERFASEKLEKGPFDYIKGNAGLGETYKSNRGAFKDWKLCPRALQNVANRDLSVELFGSKFDYPILVAPMGVQKIMHTEGELASSRAAAEIGVPYIVSTASSYSMEEVADVMGDAPRWFQLYWGKDNEITLSMLRRAERSGYSAIVLTVDSATAGWRVRDLENAYSPFRQGIGMANFFTDPVFCSKLVNHPEEDLNAAISYFFSVFGNEALSWKDLTFLRENTTLPIILKGIVHPLDAQLALEHGADGIVVSNHGGRQLDGSIGTLDALPSICNEIGGKIPVMTDSGIRTGTDVIKAIALGADAVLLGRPIAYGLSVAGQEGVKQVLKNIIAETDLSLALTGCSSIKKLDSSILIKK